MGQPTEWAQVAYAREVFGLESGHELSKTLSHICICSGSPLCAQHGSTDGVGMGCLCLTTCCFRFHTSNPVSPLCRKHGSAGGVAQVAICFCCWCGFSPVVVFDFIDFDSSGRLWLLRRACALPAVLRGVRGGQDGTSRRLSTEA